MEKKWKSNVIKSYVSFFKNRKMFILLQDNLLLEWIINLLMIKSWLRRIVYTCNDCIMIVDLRVVHFI